MCGFFMVLGFVVKIMSVCWCLKSKQRKKQHAGMNLSFMFLLF